jgi:catechol 2,3-dioxygenase-like lactoylglutathione lyase family enzyme
MQDVVTVQKPSSAERETQPIDMAIEVVVLPVTDVDRAKRFYASLGWRLDLDHAEGDSYRVIQFTPSGSGCSVIFGRNVTLAAPGSTQAVHLIVNDLDSARRSLLGRGINVSEPFHDGGGIFHHADGQGLRQGPNPQHKSYASYATFSDPDGNGWILQEVTARLAPPLLPGDARFTPELVNAALGMSAATAL